MLLFIFAGMYLEVLRSGKDHANPERERVCMTLPA